MIWTVRLPAGLVSTLVCMYKCHIGENLNKCDLKFYIAIPGVKITPGDTSHFSVDKLSLLLYYTLDLRHPASDLFSFVAIFIVVDRLENRS